MTFGVGHVHLGILMPQKSHSPEKIGLEGRREALATARTRIVIDHRFADHRVPKVKAVARMQIPGGEQLLHDPSIPPSREKVPKKPSRAFAENTTF